MCHKKAQPLEAGPRAEGGQASASGMPSQPSQWMEHLPPRLTQEAMQDTTDKPKANYPDELLDQDSMPSSRVHHSLKPGEKIRWIPCNFAYLPSNTRSTWRPTEVPVEHMRLAAAWHERIQTVFRNAWALCGASHLQNLKALDKKSGNFASNSLTPSFPPLPSS